MLSNTPVYVAGLERGVLPIGDWSIFMILSIFSMPFISLCLPGFPFIVYNLLAKPLYNISFTKVDFPEPETPVTTVNTPNGNFTFIFFKLFSLAPTTSIKLPLPFLRSFGTGIYFLRLKYCPVIEFKFCLISSTVP